MTKENLAQWITENQVDKKVHITMVPLSPEKIKELEQKIVLSTEALYSLDDLLNQIKETFKNGTPVDLANSDKEVKYLPKDYTIPPTKGTKELEATRKYADTLLKSGKESISTDLYGIPYGALKVIIFVDIEGMEYQEYRKDMTPEQIAAHGKLFDDEGEEDKKPSKPVKAADQLPFD